MERWDEEPRRGGGEGEAGGAAGGGAPRDEDGSDEAGEASNLPPPWETGAPAEAPPGTRHDGFTEARKAEFLTALVKTGCILDACRAVGVSAKTVYRHQESDPRFFDHCKAALRMSATPIELTAWQRAVEGVEQEFACGGQVHVRRRYDASLLRLLLQGSNPKKYGARPGFKRKRLLKHERKQIEREVRAEIRARNKDPSIEDVTEKIVRRVEAIKRHRQREQLAAGWTQTPDGHLIPPGYGPLPGGPAAPGADGAGAGPPRDSV